MPRSGSGIWAIFASTSFSPSALLARAPRRAAVFSSSARSAIAARSSPVNPFDFFSSTDFILNLQDIHRVSNTTSSEIVLVGLSAWQDVRWPSRDCAKSANFQLTLRDALTRQKDKSRPFRYIAESDEKRKNLRSIASCRRKIKPLFFTRASSLRWFTGGHRRSL